MQSRTESPELTELLARVAAGDQDAFAAFYDRTSRAVFGIVLHVVRDRAQAEEVAQEVYVDAWKSATSVRCRGRVADGLAQHHRPSTGSRPGAVVGAPRPA